MNEMKRRVAAILEFVGQLQTQRGTTNGTGSGGSSGGGKGGSTPNGTATISGTDSTAAALGMAGIVKAVQAAQEDVEKLEKDTVAAAAAEHVNGEVGDGGGSNGEATAGVLPKLNLRDDGEFKGMGSGDMMETLTRELVAWQRVYGFYSR